MDFGQRSGRVGGYKGGQFGIGALVLMMDFATANNTIAIVLAAPLAKQIAETFKICKTQCISLDIFSSVGQGLILTVRNCFPQQLLPA